MTGEAAVFFNPAAALKIRGKPMNDLERITALCPLMMGTFSALFCALPCATTVSSIEGISVRVLRYRGHYLACTLEPSLPHSLR